MPEGRRGWKTGPDAPAASAHHNPALPVVAQHRAIVRHECPVQGERADGRPKVADAAVGEEDLQARRSKRGQPLRVALQLRWADLNRRDGQVADAEWVSVRVGVLVRDRDEVRRIEDRLEVPRIPCEPGQPPDRPHPKCGLHIEVASGLARVATDRPSLQIGDRVACAVWERGRDDRLPIRLPVFAPSATERVPVGRVAGRPPGCPMSSWWPASTGRSGRCRS